MTTLIYIWGIIPSVIGLFVFTTIVLASSAIYNFWAFCDKRDSSSSKWNSKQENEKYLEDSKRHLKTTKKMLILSIISAAIVTFIPNKQTFAAMIIIPEIAKSDVIKKDLPEIYDMAVKKIKDELVVEVKK